MLGDNIRELRKQKGYSQEMLAEKLNVVRQTVSKWEKGYSVPDAEMLERMAELFEVSVGDLLGKETPVQQSGVGMEEVVQQLILLNDQLARQRYARKRAWKIFGIVLAGIAGLVSAVIISCVILFSVVNVAESVANITEISTMDGIRQTYELVCTLDGEAYTYTIVCDEQYQILEAGGDAWIANHVQTERYDDANVLMAQIEDYFKDHGGTCDITEILSTDE